MHAADEMYGADLILLTIVRELPAERFAAHVVVPTDVRSERQLSRALRAIGVPVRAMRLAVLRRKYLTPRGLVSFAAHLLVSVVALVRMIRRERIDVVHTHTAAVLPGAIAARLTGTPHVWHVSEIVLRPRAVARALAWLVPRLAHSVVAVSNAVRDHLVAHDPANAAKCQVVHNGIDLSAFDAATGGAAVRAELGAGDRPLVGMVGRAGTWKGQELLISAAVHVARAHPDALFLLVGGVYDGQVHHLERLRRLASDAGLAQRVVVWDYRADVAGVLAALDVFVQPSTAPDPFPTTVLEAMASAKPVVATDHGGPSEMVVDGVTGFLVPPGDAVVMAERIAALLADAGLREVMGTAGRRRVEREFSLSAFAHAYTRIYDGLPPRASG